MSKKQAEPALACPPLDGETSSAYTAFCLYRDLGPGRTQTKVVQILREMPSGGVNPCTINDWSQKYRWEERILAYESSMSRAKALAESDAVKRSIAAIYKERQERIRVSMMLADALRARAMEMLEYPIVRETREMPPVVQADGTTVIVQKVYEPVKWKTGDIPTFLNAAAQLDKAALFDDSSKTIEITEGSSNVAGAELEEWRGRMKDGLGEIPGLPAPPPGALTNPLEVIEEQPEQDDE
jgi:hypothetical protein